MPMRILLAGALCAGALALFDTRAGALAFVVALLVWFVSLTFVDPAR